MEITKDWFFQNFVVSAWKSEESFSADTETLKKIEKFIEDHPEAINKLSPESAKNLESNLESLQTDPSCIALIEKINKAIESAWQKKVTKEVKLSDSFFSNLAEYDKVKGLLLFAINRYAESDSWHKLAANISLDRIPDEALRIKTVKIMAAQNGGAIAVAWNIQKFGINNEAVRIEIAKTAAAQNGRAVAVAVAQNIQKFGINNEAARIQIAKIVAAQNGEAVAQNIQKFGINNEAARIQIAKIAAAQNGEAVAWYIQDFNIRDEAARIQIAKIAAAQNGEAVAMNIQKFDISDEAARIQIAKIAAAQDGGAVAQNIQNFNIRDEAIRIEIAKIAVTSTPLRILHRLDRFFKDSGNLKTNPQYKLFLFKVLTYGLLQEDVDSLTRFKDFKKFGPLLENELSDEENEVILGQMDVLSFFKGCIERFENAMLTDIKDKGISPCEQALKYRNKQISYLLVGAFLSEAIDTDYQEAYRSLAGTDVTPRLPSILPAKWMRDATKDAKIKNAPNFLSFFKTFKRALKNKDTGLMQIYLLTALSLDKCEGISAERKLELLSNACNQPAIPAGTPGDTVLRSFVLSIGESIDDNIDELEDGNAIIDLEPTSVTPTTVSVLASCASSGIAGNQPKEKLQEVLEGLSYLYSFSMRGQIKILNTLDITRGFITSCNLAFKEMLAKDPLVYIEGIPDFVKLYRDSFDHTRVPLALELYKAKIATLGDESVTAVLKRFVHSVLLKTFKEERFRTDINPHLAHLEKESKDIFDRWKSLEFSAPVSSFSTEAPKDHFSFSSFFETKLRDKHWHKDGSDLLPELTAYLNDLTSTPSHEVALLCKELIDGKSLSKDQQLEKVQEILGALKELSLDKLELNHDLEGLILTLPNTQASSNEKVILSNDWQDLLLAGTEVPGSCQRIDGDPQLSKCLLAYCMDGKNSMIAIKNQEGKILARSMLRLLWNEKDEKPALFLDRLYPYPCPSERENAIVGGAIECAKRLKCDLFTASKGYPKASGLTLHSLGSSCPYEYADGAEGVMPGGVFLISSLVTVYSSLMH